MMEILNQKIYLLEKRLTNSGRRYFQGRVWVESTLGRGSTFRIALPVD